MAMTFQVTFDCAKPAAIAGFWAEALGYRPAPPPNGFASWEEWFIKMEVPEEEWDEGAWINDPDGRGPTICFQQVPEGKRGKNRLHLDLDASAGRTVPMAERKRQVVAHSERLVKLGARTLQGYEQGDHFHIVMQDPEGNEFCVR